MLLDSGGREFKSQAAVVAAEASSEENLRQTAGGQIVCQSIGRRGAAERPQVMPLVFIVGIAGMQLGDPDPPIGKSSAGQADFSDGNRTSKRNQGGWLTERRP